MTQQTNEVEMLTIRQAAKQKILPERALRRLVKEGKLPVVQVGRVGYVNVALLKEWLSSGRGEVWE